VSRRAKWQIAIVLLVVVSTAAAIAALVWYQSRSARAQLAVHVGALSAVADDAFRSWGTADGRLPSKFAETTSYRLQRLQTDWKLTRGELQGRLPKETAVVDMYGDAMAKLVGAMTKLDEAQRVSAQKTDQGLEYMKLLEAGRASPLSLGLVSAQVSSAWRETDAARDIARMSLIESWQVRARLEQAGFSAGELVSKKGLAGFALASLSMPPEALGLSSDDLKRLAADPL
jgi:hypothetical protein